MRSWREQPREAVTTVRHQRRVSRQRFVADVDVPTAAVVLGQVGVILSVAFDRRRRSVRNRLDIVDQVVQGEGERALVSAIPNPAIYPYGVYSKRAAGDVNPAIP